MKENFEIISAISDSTETYFHVCNSPWGERIFRRTAILLVNNKDFEGGCLETAFMDEKGFIHEEMLEVPGPYAHDTFTVGIPVSISHLKLMERAKDPNKVLRLLRELKVEHKISFVKPEQNPFRLFVRALLEDDNFTLASRDSDALGFSQHLGDVWCKDYAFNSPESLAEIGRWLGLFRYIFDMPSLRYDLNFKYATEYQGKEGWEEGLEGGIYETPYEEQRRFELENESKYKSAWEKEIHKAADTYYNEIRLNKIVKF